MRRTALLLLLAPLTACHHAAPARVAPLPLPPPSAPLVTSPAPSVPAVKAVDDHRWDAVDALIAAGIEANKMPGCVFVVGRHDEILLERAYGSRSILPEKTPMTIDTVFDLASLTKSTATATSVMLLVDRGKIDLDARAAKYVPELAKLPPFTVRQLMIHTSGLPADTAMKNWSSDRAAVIKHIADLKLKDTPGAHFTYSDVGFVVLQEIVERVTGKSIAVFANEEIYVPLGMTETGYLPSAALKERAAPTEQRDGVFIRGDVHDPRAFVLGGVAGHAGVFSTAHDMTRFAQALLERKLLSAKTYETWLAREDTSKGGRALGWDIDSTYATHKSALLSPHAFGHGGFTGTALWVDPDKDLFVLFLSNRVHPDGKGAVNPLIGEVATAALDAIRVTPGIDVLRADGFERLKGQHVAVVSNLGARAKDGTTTIDVLRSAPGVTVSAIFTPEHGLGADKEGSIADAQYEGIPVHSLYGARSKPSAETLAGVETIVFDLQDVGVRFYTYAATMKSVMKTADELHVKMLVLDRPNPLGGAEVQGPVYQGLPVRHGMTLGELAGMFAADDHLVNPDVVRLANWRRKDSYERTTLDWTAPSPNLRSPTEVALYPAIGLLESTKLSVGRGTDVPFEIIAAPWLDPEAIIAKVTGTPGLSFEATEVTPKQWVFANKKCKAVRIRIVDRSRFEPVRAAIALATALYERHPTDWNLDGMDKMLRSKAAIDAIRDKKKVAEIEGLWALDLAAFRAKRVPFLLYE